MIGPYAAATTGATTDSTGLGFSVNDLAATAAELGARLFKPGPIGERPSGTTFVVRDPDGWRVEVKQA